VPESSFVSDSELVGLYRNFYFCYDHDARDDSCSAYEEFESVSRGFVTVRKHVVWNAKTGAMARALGYGYDVVVIESLQYLSFQPGSLCTSYPDSQAAVNRLTATTVRLDRTREPMISSDLDWLKRYWRRGIREPSCSRYRWDYGALLKTTEVDGGWSWAARISLLRDRPTLRVID
jgi:hypothetical protein